MIAVSDPQTKSKKHISQFAATPIEELAETAANLEGAVVGVVLGDVLWDKLDLYDDYKKEIVRTGIPFYPVPGNHDHELEAKGDIETTAVYRKAMGPENYAFYLGKDVVLALDNIIYDTQKQYKEGYAPHVLNWVAGLMKYVPKDADLYVVQHGTVFRWFDTDRWIVSTQEFFDLVRDHNVIFVSGHTHISTTKRT